MFSVSGRMSTKTGVAPRSTTALAVDTNVKDGMMTSSPGPSSSSIAAISSAAVQEWVSKACGQPIACSSQAWHFLVNGPSPDRCWFWIASSMYWTSLPAGNGRLNGMAWAGAARPASVALLCEFVDAMFDIEDARTPGKARRRADPIQV